jgi:hypothetical protein
MGVKNKLALPAAGMSVAVHGGRVL